MTNRSRKSFGFLEPKEIYTTFKSKLNFFQNPNPFSNQKPNQICSFNLISHDLEHSDGSDATYLLTSSQLCQNPSHAHHHSHHASYRFPVADTVVEESTGGSIVSVVGNATKHVTKSNTANINPNTSVNVNVNTGNNTTPPDIILTNSEAKQCDTMPPMLPVHHPVHPVHSTHIDETPPKVTRSLSIKSIKSLKSMDQIDEMADNDSEEVLKEETLLPVSALLSSSPPPPLPPASSTSFTQSSAQQPSLPSKTTAPATDQNSNTNNEAGTDSISKKQKSIQFHFRTFCKHIITDGI